MLQLCYGLFTPSEGESESKINYSVHISVHTKVMPNICNVMHRFLLHSQKQMIK